MKLSALAAQIKNCGHCEVINNGGRIFVGTGSAFYCMDGYPRTQDAGELGAMLGIPQKKMKNIFYHEEYCADGTQHDAHYEIHDGNGQWFVEGKDDKFSEHGNVTHWMYYPAAPKD